MKSPVEMENGPGDDTKLQLSPVRSGGPTAVSRRSVLQIAVGAGLTGFGFIAGRSLSLGGLGGSSQGPPPPPQSPSAGASVAGRDGILLLNLRPLKPYDLMGPEVTFFRTPVDGQGLAGPDIAITIGDDDPAIDAKAAVVLTVAVPKAIAPISSVSVASVGGGLVPILERLRDMGIESDVAQVTLPNRGGPVVGDLWLLVPRDRIWSPGHYELRVDATGDSFVRRFRLT